MSTATPSKFIPQNLNKDTAYCANCSACSFCVACVNSYENLYKTVPRIIERKKTYHQGEIIYKAGDEFKNLYVIRIGSVKIYSINEQGDEQITSFHLSGGIIGFDAIAENTHLSFAQAMETTSLCELSFQGLLEVVSKSQELNLRLLKLISAEISYKKNLAIMISKQTAEQRLASFLMYIVNNCEQRKLSTDQVKLSMTRYEIGNYISLTVETISRLFTKFNKSKIIEIHGKYLSIKNVDELKNILGKNQ